MWDEKCCGKNQGGFFMKLNVRLTYIFAAVAFLSHIASAFCEPPKSSEEMDEYLHSSIEFNNHKEKRIQPFSDKTFTDSRVQPSEQVNDYICESIEYNSEYRKDKNIKSFPDRCVRERRTYQLSKDCKMQTESEARRNPDGSSSCGIKGAITWNEK